MITCAISSASRPPTPFFFSHCTKARSFTTSPLWSDLLASDEVCSKSPSVTYSCSCNREGEVATSADRSSDLMEGVAMPYSSTSGCNTDTAPAVPQQKTAISAICKIAGAIAIAQLGGGDNAGKGGDSSMGGPSGSVQRAAAYLERLFAAGGRSPINRTKNCSQGRPTAGTQPVGCHRSLDTKMFSLAERVN